jgi:hypothetical protein
MYLNEKGFSVYTVISIILFLALVFILALPNFFNLDKAKNEENCINNMKLIWVAANDYMKDNLTSFNGDLKILTDSYKKTTADDAGGKIVKTRAHYLEKDLTCPENRGTKEQYIVFSKFVLEDVQGTKKMNYGTIVICPNLIRYPKHFIPKNFYENMESTEIQNYFIDDMDFLSAAAGVDGQRKVALLKRYIEIWKTDPTALTRIREDSGAIRNQVVPVAAPPAE